MILIIHDASDIFMAGSRFYFEAHKIKNKIITAFTVFMLFFSWIYLRIIVFPFCLLSNVYVNKPLPTDEWYIIHWEYLYLLSMAFVLFGMHLYWTFCLFKSAAISFTKDKIVNDFDSDKNKWKWLIYSNILACNHQFFMSSSSLYEIMYFFEKKSANN